MLAQAAQDLKYLLDRGYRKDYSLRFVSDHYRLEKRDRNRLMREIFSEDWIKHVKNKLYPANAMQGEPVAIDGFNVLITLDSALNGGEVFRCLDGFIRDNTMAFSNYRILEKTRKAADEVLETLMQHDPKHVTWVFDSQISQSGRLAEYVRRRMKESDLSGESMTSPNADYKIEKMNLLTATSDSAIIQRINYVMDLPSAVIDI